MRTAGGVVGPRGVLFAAGICPAEGDAAVRETAGVTCKKKNTDFFKGQLIMFHASRISVAQVPVKNTDF